MKRISELGTLAVTNTIATLHHIPVDGILHSHHRENLKSFRYLGGYFAATGNLPFYVQTCLKTGFISFKYILGCGSLGCATA
jgi:hypothetical protein